jgi:hypothetical protein
MQDLSTSVGEHGQSSAPLSVNISSDVASGLTLKDAGAIAPAKKHGWLSLLRSYFIFDPLIWLYTVVLGIVSVPVSLFGQKSAILHGFARFWSWLIMKTILSPVKVTGLEKIDASRLCRHPRVRVGHSGALRLLAIPIPDTVQEGIALLSHRRMALETVGAGLHRSAETNPIDRPHPVGGEKSTRRNAARDFSRRRPHPGWRDQAVHAGSCQRRFISRWKICTTEIILPE